MRWCVDSEDWKHPSAETIVATACEICVRAPSSFSTTAAAATLTHPAPYLLLDRLASEGYTFVTVPEMLQAWDRFLSQQSTESTDIS